MSDIANRLPRVHLLPNHRLAFNRFDLPKIETVQVDNISGSGIGFKKITGTQWPEKDSNFTGELVYKSSTYPTKLKVMHVSDEIVGCRFEARQSSMMEFINDFFNAELTALKMKVSRPAQDGGGSIVSHSFSGPNNGFVEVQERENKVLQFSISFYDYVLEWADGLELKTGTASQSREPRWDRDVDLEIAHLCHRFVANIEPLEAEIKKSLQEIVFPQNILKK